MNFGVPMKQMIFKPLAAPLGLPPHGGHPLLWWDGWTPAMLAVGKEEVLCCHGVPCLAVREVVASYPQWSDRGFLRRLRINPRARPFPHNLLSWWCRRMQAACTARWLPAGAAMLRDTSRALLENSSYCQVSNCSRCHWSVAGGVLLSLPQLGRGLMVPGKPQRICRREPGCCSAPASSWGNCCCSCSESWIIQANTVLKSRMLEH